MSATIATHKATSLAPRGSSTTTNWMESVRTAAFVIGSALLCFVAATNTVTDLAQRFWGASGNFWQSGYDSAYQFFGGTEYSAGLWGTTSITLGVFWPFNALLIVLDSLNWPRFLTRYKVQPDKNVPVDRRQLAKAVATVLFNQLVVGIPFSMATYYIYQWRGTMHAGELPTLQWVILEIGVFVLAEEIFFYYSHRMLHHPSVYR